jgi:ankyrin repeat protein
MIGMFFWTMGMFGLDTAKKVLDLTGLDDGASVFSAAENRNIELIQHLLKEGVSPNKPFKYSTGNVTTALHKMIEFGELEAVKALIDAGADTKVRNQYDNDCLETARSYKDIREAGQDILDLLEKS